MARTFFPRFPSLALRVGVPVLAVLLAAAGGASAEERLAVKGGRVVPVAGPAIDGGVVLIKDGKIEAVGKDLPVPSQYRVIDATGKVVLPGFIEAHSSRGMDQANERNNNVPFLSVIDAIDPGQEYFEDCRRNGVTTVAIVPGDDTMIGGQAAVIKTAGSYVEQMTLKRQAGIKLSLRPPNNRSRMSHLASLRKELDAARDALQTEANKPKTPEGKPDAPKPEKKDGDKSAEPTQPEPATGDNPDPMQESAVDAAVRRAALVKLLKGEMPAFVYCDAAMDVPQAVKLTQEYKLKTILVLGHNCYKAVKQVAESKLPVILDPTLVFWETDPRSGEERKIVLPKVYRDAGVPVTFQVTGGAAGTLFRAPDLPATLGTNYLWYQAATAVKYGMPVPEAIEAITLRPAQVLGVEGLVGTIEPGKDADLVILTGEPLKITTWVDTTLVRGKVVYERAKDRKLEHLLQPASGKVESK
jgi:imidazolonepropionase-like amidohydrolase